MSKLTDAQVLSKWITDIAGGLAQENFKLLHAIGASKKLSDKMMMTFLQYYTKQLVKSALNKYAKSWLTQEDQYTLTSKAFRQVKYEIQESIAKGFEGAFNEFLGNQVEYYCEINPVPDRGTKETS